MRKTSIPLILLGALLVSSCTMSPDYTRPDVATQAQWSQGQTAEVEIARDWWRGFNSAELDSLMQQALAQNTDLAASLARVEQARASLRIAGADFYPSLSGSGGASRSKTNPSSGDSKWGSGLNAGLSASYELDLFGANRAKADAAQANYLASGYDKDALELVVMGDVAAGYFTLLNQRERLEIADTNLANAREVLRIIQARVDAGAESELELAQQRSAVASREASRASIAEQIANAENALAVLIGQPPQSVSIAGKGLGGLSVPSIAAGQPSDLLERRPDLRSAEASLLAANANIGAARAAFFPSITLGLGNSLSLAGFGDPSASVLSLASSIAVPIFQGGALQGGLDQATARQVELAENYRGTVLRAFQDVEDALAAVNAAQERERALAVSMESARTAYRLSKSRYDAGSIDFQTLLDTQDSQLAAEDSYAQARLARLQAAIDLYAALGGGWASS